MEAVGGVRIAHVAHSGNCVFRTLSFSPRRGLERPVASEVAKLRSGLNATTHAVFAVAALAGASLIAGTEPPAYAYPVAVAAAWLPDVDNPRSTLGNG